MLGKDNRRSIDWISPVVYAVSVVSTQIETHLCHDSCRVVEQNSQLR
jgi:hypothetical protein